MYPNDGYVSTAYSDKLLSNPYQMVHPFVRTTTTLEANKFAQSYSYADARGLTIRTATQTPDGWSPLLNTIIWAERERVTILFTGRRRRPRSPRGQNTRR